jgi:hypothetical protein
LVQNSLGPHQAADKLYPNYQDYELPNLKTLSDMMWILWSYFVPADKITNLRFMMSLGINNPQTLTIIRRALDSAGQSLTSTPYKFEMHTEGALALLGESGFYVLTLYTC